MYNMYERCKVLNLKCNLLDDLSWDDIDNQIKKNDTIMENDDGVYMNINNTNDFDDINYNNCIQRLLDYFSSNENNNSGSSFDDPKLLFSFDDKQHCMVTNYSYISIFFGPSDDIFFFKKEYEHIFKKKDSKIEINIRKYADRIFFDVLLDSKN